MADATTLEEIQQATDYNQAEHEDILRLYAAFFNRPPDAAGARYWIVDIYEGLGANLDQIVAEFALSQEFGNTYGSVNNSEYLQILYQRAATATRHRWFQLLAVTTRQRAPQPRVSRPLGRRRNRIRDQSPIPRPDSLVPTTTTAHAGSS